MNNSLQNRYAGAGSAGPYSPSEALYQIQIRRLNTGAVIGILGQGSTVAEAVADGLAGLSSLKEVVATMADGSRFRIRMTEFETGQVPVRNGTLPHFIQASATSDDAVHVSRITAA